MRVKRTRVKLWAFVLTVVLLFVQSCFNTVFAMDEVMPQVEISDTEPDVPVQPESLTVTGQVYGMAKAELLLPGESVAVQIDIGTISEGGTGFSYSGNTVTVTESVYDYIITGTTNTNKILVKSGVKANIILNGANIDVSSISEACAFDMTGAEVNLTLEGVNVLKSGAQKAGLCVPEGAKLTITEESTGSITANGSVDGAGIGGSSCSGGIVNIDGGMVTAIGGGDGWWYGGGAGIGGASGFSGGIININGGIVTAKGGGYYGTPEWYGTCGGAGIGGGFMGSGGTINISGGTVIAEGGSFITGIGCGNSGSGGNIVINGGNIVSSLGAAPYDNNKTPVYKFNLRFKGIFEPTSVDSLSISYDGSTLAYGCKDMYTDNQGCVYLYLPKGIDAEITATAGGKTIHFAGAVSDIESNNQYTLLIGETELYSSDTFNYWINRNDAKITLLDNVILPATIDAAGSNIILDLNGFSLLTPDSKYGCQAVPVINIAGGDLTVLDSKGGGRIQAGVNSYPFSPGFEGKPAVSIKGGKLVLESGELVGGKGYWGNEAPGSYGIEISGSGEAEVKGGIISGNVGYFSTPEPGVYVKDSGKLIVSGGTVKDATLSGNAVLLQTGGAGFKINQNETSVFIIFPLNVSITYGQTLGEAVLTGHSSTIEGSFAFNDDALAPKAAESGTEYAMTFTPNTEGYGSITQNIAVTVNRKELVSDVTILDKLFDGTDTAIAAPLLQGIVGNDDVMLSGNPTFTFLNAYAGNDKWVEMTGEYTLTGSDSGNYTLRQPEMWWKTGNITQAVPSVNLTASEAKVHDTVVLTATAAGVEGFYPVGDIIFKKNQTELGTVSLSNGTAVYEWNNVPLGTYTITAEYTGDRNYTAASGSIEGYNISKKAQAPLNISGVPQTVTYGNSPFALNISGGSGNGEISFEVNGTSVRVDSNGIVGILGAGQSTITVTKGEDEEYNHISEDVTIDVKKAVPNITVPPTASAVSFGSALSASRLAGGIAAGIGGTQIAGSFTWSNPSQTVSVADNYGVTFMPEDSGNYTAAEALARVNVIYPDNSDSEDSSAKSEGTNAAAVSPNRDVLAGINITGKTIEDAIRKGQSLFIVLTKPAVKKPDCVDMQSIGTEERIIALKLNLEALKEIQNKSIGNITVTVTPAQNLSTEAEALIGMRPLYNITLSYDKNGKIEYITKLNKGKAALSIPYMPDKGERTGYLFAVYVDSSGDALLIADSAYDTDSKSIIFTTNHFSVYGVGYKPMAADFTDTAQHWAKESIDYAVGRDILSGTSTTTVSPDKTMGLGMLAKALGRLADADVTGYTTSSFTDIKWDSCFLPYIEWAYKNRIIDSIEADRFASDKAVTREEFAMILINYARAKGYIIPINREAVAFADSSSISNPAKNAVKAMQQAGIMIGDKNNKFNPQAGITRAEVAVALNRYVKLIIDNFGKD